MAQQTCIVTGKVFDDEKGGFKWMHEGQWFWFSDIGARNRFIADPQKYLQPAGGTSS